MLPRFGSSSTSGSRGATRTLLLENPVDAATARASGCPAPIISCVYCPLALRAGGVRFDWMCLAKGCNRTYQVVRRRAFSAVCHSARRHGSAARDALRERRTERRRARRRTLAPRPRDARTARCARRQLRPCALVSTQTAGVVQHTQTFPPPTRLARPPLKPRVRYGRDISASFPSVVENRTLSF